MVPSNVLPMMASLEDSTIAANRRSDSRAASRSVMSRTMQVKTYLSFFVNLLTDMLYALVDPRVRHV